MLNTHSCWIRIVCYWVASHRRAWCRACLWWRSRSQKQGPAAGSFKEGLFYIERLWYWPAEHSPNEWTYLQPHYCNGVFEMFTFQLDDNKKQTLQAPLCCNGSCRYVRAMSDSPQKNKMKLMPWYFIWVLSCIVFSGSGLLRSSLESAQGSSKLWICDLLQTSNILQNIS